MIFFLRMLPRKWLSHFIGKLMHFKGPSFWSHYSIRFFVWLYDIKVEEAEKPLAQYRSIGDLFTRRLKAGLRPLSPAFAVHPCDSRILQQGVVNESTLVQAKGYKYGLVELTEDPNAGVKWNGGLFVTYYLCPTDYHRVHSPISGFIKSVMYRNGDLWPVNLKSVSTMKDLYIENERLVVEIATDEGPVAVILVGATNVGSMTLAFDKTIRTNRNMKSKRHVYPIPIEIQKGDELGTFHMGSTVIVIYGPDFRKKYHGYFSFPNEVKCGESLTIEHLKGNPMEFKAPDSKNV